ncbi:MAG: hypothetical protein JW893_02520 [Candidatus Omnitrophica bacterium]|nr:hypothetical protein [Candidatus Omnitrophota bacterium]
MKKILAVLLVLILAASVTPAFAGEYQDNMQKDFVRGFKNVIGGWMEVPITIQEYHQGAGRPVIRHISGALDGLFQTVVRTGSGMWDFIAAFIPDHQQGMPVDPETLF